jgi:HPt (histidine-containing phosphotransfer) domain-containing protein
MANAAIRNDVQETVENSNRPMPDRSIDLVFLAQQSLGDRDLEVELLTLFEKQAETIAARLVKPVCSGDRKWQHDLAHTLKGSARAVGASRVAVSAEEFEAALAAGVSAETLAEYAGRLDHEVAAARKVILDLIAGQ